MTHLRDRETVPFFSVVVLLVAMHRLGQFPPQKKQGGISQLATACLEHDQTVVQFRFETILTFGEVRPIEF